MSKRCRDLSAVFLCLAAALPHHSIFFYFEVLGLFFNNRYFFYIGIFSHLLLRILYLNQIILCLNRGLLFAITYILRSCQIGLLFRKTFKNPLHGLTMLQQEILLFFFSIFSPCSCNCDRGNFIKHKIIFIISILFNSFTRTMLSCAD